MNRKTFIEKSARGLFLGALAFVSLVFFKRSQVELERCNTNQLCKSCKKFDACQLPEKTSGDEHPATKKS
jgi:nitrate/TMAO reductase-like tetraheme cytochrome c subunit